MEQLKQVAREVFYWTNEHIQPSSPHQENIIWLEVLRPLQHTNWEWVRHWGNDYIV